MNNPTVDIVLLNWNGFEKTADCIRSLMKASYPAKRIVLVDNASADGSGPKLRDEFPWVTYVQNNENLGFSRGCNTGIRAALAQGADFVLLLNNDMTLQPGFLEPMVQLAQQDKSIGLVSGKIFLDNDSGRLWYAGGHISLLSGSVVVREHLQFDRGVCNRTEPTNACTGAMMLISRAVLEKVGPLPEEYFFGQEEWDYSLTVQRAGFKLYYCAEAVAYHQSDGSHRNLDPKFLYCGARNRLIFQAKFLPAFLFPVWARLYLFYVRFVAPRRLKISAEEIRAFQASVRAAWRDHCKSPRLFVKESDLRHFQQEYRSQAAQT